jgi:hypothetical protein
MKKHTQTKAAPARTPMPQLIVELDNPLSVIPGHSIKEAEQPHTPVAIVHATRGSKGPKAGRERAKYIVRAVNSHADLVAALNALVEWEAFMGGFEAPAWQAAHDALAKAKGATP